MLTTATLRRALVALLLAVPLVATGGTAQAAACSGTSGVTVVVQFTSGTVTRCAPGDPSSGTQALTSAGFSVSYVNGQAFVCKINNQPDASGCARTPPASAYWAYFHAKRGGSWAYSSAGATTYNPAPGSVEGWRFGNGAKPSTAPPAATPKPKPTPKPTPTPTPKPTPKPKPTSHPTAASTRAAGVKAGPKARGTAAARAARTRAAEATSTSTATAKAKAKAKATAKANAKAKDAKATAAPGTTPSDSATATGQPSEAASALDRTGPDADQGGGNVPWLWGLVGLAVIGGAAGAVTLARRH